MRRSSAGIGKPAVGHSRGDDHGPGRRLAVVGQRDDALIAAAAQLGRLVGEDELGPEQHRLLPGPVRQDAAADAPRKAKIVTDHGACAGLAADRVRFQHDSAQPFRRARDGGRQASGPGAHHGKVIGFRRWPGMDSVRLGDLGEARIVPDLAAVVDDRGKPPHVDAVLADQLLAFRRVGGVELEGDAVAAQHVPQLMAAGSPLLTDDPVHHVSGPVRERPRRERLLHLRVEPFLRGDPSLDHRKVNQAQGGGLLQRGELGERHPRVIPVHGHQQDPAGARVQRPRPLQELHAAYVGQPQISRHQCHLTARSASPLESVQAVLSSFR